MFPTVLKSLVVCCCVVALSGCLRAYKMDIQQGNVVTQEMLDQLKPGMSRREVRFVLGSPMIEDPFHADRWDYAYVLRKGRDPNVERNVVTVIFENDKLASVAGDASIAVEQSRVKIDTPRSLDPNKAKKKKKPIRNFFKKLKDKVTPKKDS